MVFNLSGAPSSPGWPRVSRAGLQGASDGGRSFRCLSCRRLLEDVPAFDSIVCGEGERSCARSPRKMDTLGDVAGLVWRSGDAIVAQPSRAQAGRSRSTGAGPRTSNPADEFLGFPIANLLASRGCTHGCGFCSSRGLHQLCGGPRLRGPLARAHRPGGRAFSIARACASSTSTTTTSSSMIAQPGLERFSRTRAGTQTARRWGASPSPSQARPDRVDEELFAFLKSLGMFVCSSASRPAPRNRSSASGAARRSPTTSPRSTF